MSVLAFKALGYGAEQIPDKVFEKIPGGFFKPEDEKKDSKKSRSSPKEKSRRNSDRSRREHSPQNGYSDYSNHDTDEEEQRRKERRRRKSAARSTSRSRSRGRDKQRSRDVDGEYSDRDMAYSEQGQGQGPYFPPPPTSEYAPYNHQEHASRSNQGDYRPTSAQPQYGYPTQCDSSDDGLSPDFGEFCSTVVAEQGPVELAVSFRWPAASSIRSPSSGNSHLSFFLSVL
ncbi:hypothetical protein N0V91_001881 [Didymella pomorum]|uniref:Uncharacterized protein n=1 Tax=Didymella pomorum TaxID=749634 RepID=A0A9W8ZLV7_9PLEO|nr:hypothetical protein N0V91_001881 [Didymella pomorum]